MNTDAQKRRLRKIMRHQGYEITVSGVAYDCYPAAMRDRELNNRDHTFRETYDTTVVIRTDDVSVSIGDTVTLNGTTRRVLDVGKTPDTLQTLLHLGQQY